MPFLVASLRWTITIFVFALVIDWAMAVEEAIHSIFIVWTFFLAAWWHRPSDFTFQIYASFLTTNIVSASTMAFVVAAGTKPSTGTFLTCRPTHPVDDQHAGKNTQKTKNVPICLHDKSCRRLSLLASTPLQFVMEVETFKSGPKFNGESCFVFRYNHSTLT